MKLRLLPVLLTVFISAAAMFGGWFVYQSFAVEHPIGASIESLSDVRDVAVDSDSKELRIRLTLEEDSDLYKVYQEIKAQVDKKPFTIEIMNESSPELDKLWSSTLFSIAEAMETSTYSTIPQTLDALQTEIPGLDYNSAMDEKNVYISLHMDGQSKYIVMPRYAHQIGVWPNEQI